MPFYLLSSSSDFGGEKGVQASIWSFVWIFLLPKKRIRLERSTLEDKSVMLLLVLEIYEIDYNKTGPHKSENTGQQNKLHHCSIKIENTLK